MRQLTPPSRVTRQTIGPPPRPGRTARAGGPGSGPQPARADHPDGLAVRRHHLAHQAILGIGKGQIEAAARNVVVAVGTIEHLHPYGAAESGHPIAGRFQQERGQPAPIPDLVHCEPLSRRQSDGGGEARYPEMAPKKWHPGPCPRR